MTEREQFEQTSTERLAKRIRDILGPYNDDTESLQNLISKLVLEREEYFDRIGQLEQAARAASPRAGQGVVEVAWQPIATAPTDNRCSLYLARFVEGRLVEIDFDGAWERLEESLEMPHINGWAWVSANGIESPTHWAYQDQEIPPVSEGMAIVPQGVEGVEDAYQALQNELIQIQATIESFATPAAALSALIDWHVSVATDPRVNGGMAIVPVDSLHSIIELAGVTLVCQPFGSQDRQHFDALCAAVKEQERAWPISAWISTADQMPPEGVQVLGFSKAWIDEDFNPEGMRECFLCGDGDDWNSAWWNDPVDQYETQCGRTGGHGAPTHWMPRPQPPKE